jgi:hypothetical protein
LVLFDTVTTASAKKLPSAPSTSARNEPDEAALDRSQYTLPGLASLQPKLRCRSPRASIQQSTRKREQLQARLRAENSELLDRDTVEAVARLFIEKYAKATRGKTSWWKRRG